MCILSLVHAELQSSPALESDSSMSSAPGGTKSSAPEAKPLLTTPTLSKLNSDVIRYVAPDWELVGYHLGIENCLLGIIQADNPRSVECCCHQMFAKWLSHTDGTGGNPRTWKSVLLALRNLGYSSVVGDVEKSMKIH